MEKQTEEKLNELIELIKSLITKEGFIVSNNGYIGNNTKDMIEWLKKIDTKLYWMEKRDKERSETMKGGKNE